MSTFQTMLQNTMIFAIICNYISRIYLVSFLFLHSTILNRHYISFFCGGNFFFPLLLRVFLIPPSSRRVEWKRNIKTRGISWLVRHVLRRRVSDMFQLFVLERLRSVLFPLSININSDSLIILQTRYKTTTRSNPFVFHF